AKAIAMLAFYCNTLDHKYVEWTRQLDSPKQSSYDPYARNVGVVMEHWILLHELGHAALGHLKDDDVSQTQLSNGIEVNVFNRSEQQEFEADEFACNQFMAYSTDQERFRGTVFGFGLCLTPEKWT